MDFTSLPVETPIQIGVTLETGELVPLMPNLLGRSVMAHRFQSQDNVVGRIKIVPVLKRFQHTGIKVELLGEIETLSDRCEFISHVRQLEIPGDLYEAKTYPFHFMAVKMPHDTYNGVTVNLSYILKFTIIDVFGGIAEPCLNILVHNCRPAPSINNPIKTEFRAENHFHAEVEYSKCVYHLKDVISGNICFIHVEENKGIKGVHIEFLRIESTNTVPDVGMNDDPNDDPHVEKTTLAKVRLKNGAPVIGESIPIRLFLRRYELTPTYDNTRNIFSVKYYLQLVVADEDGQLLYSEKQEITMYRHVDDEVS